jgi:predicted transcriptional regulator
MNEKAIQDIFDVSQTFASGKRLLLLFILRDEPMGYTLITKYFERMGVPIGSSEVYKHLKQLLDAGFITKKGNSYILTLRGLRATETTVDIINTPPEVPELKLSFNNRREAN